MGVEVTFYAFLAPNFTLRIFATLDRFYLLALLTVLSVPSTSLAFQPDVPKPTHAVYRGTVPSLYRTVPGTGMYFNSVNWIKAEMLGKRVEGARKTT